MGCNSDEQILRFQSCKSHKFPVLQMMTLKHGTCSGKLQLAQSVKHMVMEAAIREHQSDS